MTQQSSEPARSTDPVFPPPAGIDTPALPPRTSLHFEAPNLLLEWDSRPRTFFRNLFDLLLFRKPPEVAITARPTTFWPDVFVDQRVSRRALFDSALVHVFMVVVIVGFTETYIRWRPPELHDPFNHTKLTYYEVSEYLPEVHTSPHAVEEPRKPAREGVPEAPADPTYAKQEIISVPPDPDNLRQTIVTPSPVRIDRDVPLPNIVTAQPPKAVEALQVANNPVPKLEMPPEIVAPRMKVAMAPPEIADAAVPKPVEVMNVANRPGPKSLTPPEADAPKLQIGMKLPEVSTGAAPKAAPTPIQVSNGRVRNNATPVLDVAAPRIQGSVAAPILATNRAAQLPKPAAPAPASNTNGAGATPTSPQQIIALSTHPTAPSGTLNVPEGSRRGTFAAGPNGRADATGAPATTADRTGAASSTTTTPAGIHVGAGDSSPHSGVVASGTPTTPPASDLKNRMIAMAKAPTIPPPRVEPEAKSDNDPTAKAVFGEKRFYKLTVNMPNLTSASGSWVIRFAELHPRADQSQIALAAPVALSKSDPAYPPDLMKDKVEGTVILYAIIRADGSITDVKILNSVNQRLDESAIAALHRWKFAPGSKQNQAVDVEAVVQVPFKVKRLSF
jgi:TonB family protein